MLTDLVRPIYNRLLRPMCPRKLGYYNGVVARAPKLFDMTDHIPDYKDALLEAVREAVTPGDHVVVIGGGKGIASVVAAEAAGPDGQVTTYEVRREVADLCRETQALNGVAGRATVEWARVGPVLDGGPEMTPSRTVADLPSPDALVLDCEGAERPILTSLGRLDAGHAARPDCIVVETHTDYAAPPDAVRDALAGADYRVTQVREPQWATDDSPDRILYARRYSAQTSTIGPSKPALESESEVTVDV